MEAELPMVDSLRHYNKLIGSSRLIVHQTDTSARQKISGLRCHGAAPWRTL